MRGPRLLVVARHCRSSQRLCRHRRNSELVPIKTCCRFEFTPSRSMPPIAGMGLALSFMRRAMSFNRYAETDRNHFPLGDLDV